METNLKFNSAICTSRTQSERLLALGLKKETADMYITNMSIKGKNYTDGWTIGTIPYAETMLFWKEKGLILEKTAWQIIPAWSLHRLIEMMPLYFLDTQIMIRHHGVSMALESGNNLYDELITLIGDCIKHGMLNKEYLEE